MTGKTEGEIAGLTVDPVRSLLKWQAEIKRWETSKRKARFARRVLEGWVCDGIRIEIEDLDNLAVAYAYIKDRYAVSNEFA